MAQKPAAHGMAAEGLVVLLVMTALYWPYEFVLWLVHTI